MKKIKTDDTTVEVVEVYGKKGNYTMTLPKSGTPILLRSSNFNEVIKFNGHGFDRIVLDEFVPPCKPKSKGQQLREYLERTV